MKEQVQSRIEAEEALAPENPSASAGGLADELYCEALAFFDADDLVSAQKLFQKLADGKPTNAQARSYLGVCVAANEHDFERASALCSAAAKEEFFNPDLYLNLARVHLIFGFKSEGRRYLLRGGMIDPANERIQVALEQLGARSEPVLRFLPRRHLINRWLGGARCFLQVRGRTQVTA